MACPHGNGAPAACSQCLGAPARRVAIVGRSVVIDGELVGSTKEQMAREHADQVRLPSQHRGAGQHAIGAVRHCTRCGREGHNSARCAS